MSGRGLHTGGAGKLQPVNERHKRRVLGQSMFVPRESNWGQTQKQRSWAAADTLPGVPVSTGRRGHSQLRGLQLCQDRG